MSNSCRLSDCDSANKIMLVTLLASVSASLYVCLLCYVIAQWLILTDRCVRRTARMVVLELVYVCVEGSRCWTDRCGCRIYCRCLFEPALRHSPGV